MLNCTLWFIEGEIGESSIKQECPVCKYMKAGACKSFFEGWEQCLESIGPEEEITKCVGATVKMMRCMKNDEYYDIMTAGTDYDKIDMIDPEKAAAANPNPARSDAH